jgi:ATP-dependent helicase HrpB
VLQAPPGAGKTTRVPLALLGEPWAGGGKIVMLEPRRLAARAAARWMATTLGESVGESVGYRVRGDSRVGRRTRVEVVTEGVLTRLIQDDPALEGIALVIFDEFHERNLVADLGLALALQSADLLRPDLRILVMSATLDGAAVAALLGDAPIVTSAGRSHPVETRWVPKRADVRIEGAVASVVERALVAHEGDVLVFLPGAAEIRRVESLLGERQLGAGTRVYALHGSLPLEEQDRAIAPSPAGSRKVVLATSVAETSLTIAGVRVVVDSGLARVPRFAVRAGMTRLETVRVSRDAADQRRGRAGRVASGTCYRLWDEAEHAQLLERRTPEMLEADLAPLALELAAAGIDDPRALRWLDVPPAGAYAQARELLAQLGALDADGRLTKHGAAMAGIGIHPRLAHLLVRGAAMGFGALACDVAALLAERDVLRRDAAIADPDLRTRVELLRAPAGAHDVRVDRGRLFQVRDEARRLRDERGVHDAAPDLAAVGALVALAYPDRLGMRRAAERGRFVLRNGRGARVDEATPLADADFIAVAGTDGAAPEAKVYLAAPLSRREIETVAGNQIVREDFVEFDDTTGAVRAVTRERLGALVISERVQHDVNATAMATAIVAAVRRAGIAGLPWSEGARRTRERLAFVRQHDASWPDVSDAALLDALDDWLLPSLTEARRWSDIERLDLGALLLGHIGWERRAALDELAPTHLTVPSGSRVPLDYADPAAPVLAVRLQEMFGATDTPRVARGQVAVTLHLLSPAARPVQVTRDLAGFWARTYFDVRKDLRGRYPRHYWPDDPLVAQPTKRVKPR